MACDEGRQAFTPPCGLLSLRPSDRLGSSVRVGGGSHRTFIREGGALTAGGNSHARLSRCARSFIAVKPATS